MGKISCICGEVLGDSLVPNPIKYLMMKDESFDSFFEYHLGETRIMNEGNLNDVVTDLYLTMIKARECPKCKRFWVFKNGSNSARSCYECKGEI